MEYNLATSVAGIAQINSSLHNKKTISNENLNKTVTNLGKFLHNIELHTNAGLSPLTGEYYRIEIAKTLQELRQNLASIKESKQENQLLLINQTIDKIEKSLGTSSLPANKNTPVSPVSLAFFADIEGKDVNGAISIDMCKAIEQDVPFIITVSMLQEKGTGDGILARNEFTAKLLEHKNKFAIYERGGMLVFIPHSFSPGKDETEKLQAFDFKTDGSLKIITVDEALNLSVATAKLENALNLFSDDPKANKIFYLSGHGGSQSVGGLSSNDYKNFLKFLAGQHCKGLAINSCYAGGNTSTLNVPDQPLNQASFLDQEPPHHFPVLVRSIGDFATSGGLEAEQDLKGFLATYSEFIAGKEPQTFAALGKKMQNLEKNKPKFFTNYMQFYPAHGAKIPGGFRPIRERGAEDFSLTVSKVKGGELAPKISNKALPYIEIEAKRIDVHPLVTQIPLRFYNQIPQLLSMIPGSAQHFFSKIQLVNCKSTPESPAITEVGYINEILQFYMKQPFFGANKGCFIHKMSSEAGEISDVAIFISAQPYAVYKKANEYFLFNPMIPYPNQTRRITQFEHSFYCELIVKDTCPEEKAIRMASAGRENSSDFSEALNNCGFNNASVGLLNLQVVPFKMAPNFFELVQNKLSQEKTDILNFLLERGYLANAFEMIIRYPDLHPPLQIYSDSSFWGFVSYHPNALEFTNRLQMTPASAMAIINTQNIDMIRLVIEKTTLTPAMFNAIISLNNLDLVKLAVEKGANLNQLSEDLNLLPLQAVLLNPEGKLIFKWLVERGADLNLTNGIHSPFYYAVKSQDLDLVEFCIAHGAKVRDYASAKSPLSAAFNPSDPSGKLFKILISQVKNELTNKTVGFSFIGNLNDILTNMSEYCHPELVGWIFQQGLIDYQFGSSQNSSIETNFLVKAIRHSNDPKGELFAQLHAAGIPLTDLPPNLLSRFLLRVYDAGNLPLFRLCLKELSPPAEQSLWLFITTRKHFEAAKIYIETSGGKMLDSSSLVPLLQLEDTSFLEKLLDVGLDKNIKFENESDNIKFKKLVELNRQKV